MTNEEAIDQLESHYRDARDLARAFAACLRAARRGQRYVEVSGSGDIVMPDTGVEFIWVAAPECLSEAFDFAELWTGNGPEEASKYARLQVGEELNGYRRVS